MRTKLTRRVLFEAMGAGTIGSVLPSAAVAQSSATTTRPGRPMLNRFPRMVQEYFVGQARSSEQEGLQALAALQTKADAEAHVRALREKIRRCFGPLPEKTPLNARTTGVVERDRYRIENVIFESRPGFLVTANLYLPRNQRLPAPGVVGACGHSTNGKAGDTYQSFAQGLARLGYICLIYDPIGQGERIEYAAVESRPKIGPGVGEHLHAGNQQFLVGEFAGTWRAWDGIRALDYLLTRPEVDTRHIGVTGNSGGGTETTWLCGLETRWTMAAAGCFVTTFRRNLENELPADTEQCPPSALALGLDHADFIAAMAPKPVILLGKEKDFFDARGLEEAYARLKRLYRLLGAEDNIALFLGPGYHGYTQENREAMYRWFNRITGISDARTEPALVLEKDATLYCAPRGQVAELKSKSLFAFTKGKSEALAKQRQPLSGEALHQAVVTTLRLPARTGVPDYRILRPIGNRAFPKKYFATYVVETEPGIAAIVYRLSDDELYSRPPRGKKRAILYVSHQSADAELRDEPLIRELLQAELRLRRARDRGIAAGHLRHEYVSQSLRQRLLLRHSFHHARSPLCRPADPRCPDGARMDAGAGAYGSASGRQRLGRDPGHVRRVADSRGNPSDFEERLGLLLGHGPIDYVSMAARDAGSQRARALRSTGLLPCAGA